MAGKSSVRAAMAVAERKLPRRPTIADPAPNEPRYIEGQEFKPGQWIGDIWGMPPDCPVEPLGMDGDILYCMDAIGQLAAVAPSAMGQKFIQRLFGERQHYLYWAWPRFGQKGGVEAWRTEKVAECFYTAAARRGLFSPVDKVRGRGAWRDRHGHLIYHSGDALWHTGKRGKKSWEPIDTGFHDGVFYPRRPNIAAPWPEPVTPEDNPARLLLSALRGWHWDRPEVDPVLALGAMAAQFLGGALTWRPTVFLTGDKAVGKSTLQALFKGVLGDALVASADTTAAGIYQRIAQDSLAVAVDELEAEADSRKVMAVVKLARLAASGSMMFRGGQDHTGVEFRAQSCFLFSSINPPPLAPQDVSRMALLRLKKLDAAGSGAGAPTVDADVVGPMLLRQLCDNWGRFDAALAAYRDVLRAAGHDGRGQDTLGVLLACADLALGPELAEEMGVPMVDDLGRWGELLAPSTMLEFEDQSENWRGCLKHLLTSRVDAWRAGNQHTVGAQIDLLRDKWGGVDGKAELERTNTMLAQAGLAVIVDPRVDGDLHRGFVLAVPNESQLVASLFRDTVWVGAPGASVWKSALRQGPATIICVNPKLNRRRINGVQERCTLVRLRAFDEEE